MHNSDICFTLPSTCLSIFWTSDTNILEGRGAWYSKKHIWNILLRSFVLPFYTKGVMVRKRSRTTATCLNHVRRGRFPNDRRTSEGIWSKELAAYGQDAKTFISEADSLDWLELRAPLRERIYIGRQFLQIQYNAWDGNIYRIATANILTAGKWNRNSIRRSETNTLTGLRQSKR
jgi:hypothetical protein